MGPGPLKPLRPLAGKPMIAHVVERLRPQVMDLVIVADYALTETAALAHLFIPLAGWHEMEGTVVNFQGTAQKMARAVVPPKDRKAFYEVVSLWLREAGVEAPEPGFLAWHAEVKKAVPALRDVLIRDLLPNGVKLEGAP